MHVDPCWLHNSEDIHTHSFKEKNWKSCCEKSKKTLAQEALKDPATRKYITEMLGKELAQEVKAMASDGANSILQSQDSDHLKDFNWNMLLSELSKYAPLLNSFLSSATTTKTPRPNTDAVIGMCAAILLHNRNRKLNLVQKIHSLILYAGHTSKKVYCIE